MGKVLKFPQRTRQEQTPQEVTETKPDELERSEISGSVGDEGGGGISSGGHPGSTSGEGGTR